ncbi:MAG: molybdopterin cofactor-binding domain-containing protein [Marmoricola sp.]
MTDTSSLRGPVRTALRASLGRRTFVGYVLGGATLAVAADLSLGDPAFAAIPSGPQIPETYDLEDAQTDAARPTANLITVTIDDHGEAHFALPRAEVGQGITTSTAMIIAEELDLPVAKVHVSLAPARPELEFNQLTGGSNTSVSTFTPIRVAAAIAKKALLDAAAIELGSAVALLQSKDGVITGPTGSTTYGAMASKAASSTTRQVSVSLKSTSDFTVLGKPHNRVDARDIVTGRKKFAMDTHIGSATPVMLCRAPKLNGTPKRVLNEKEVLALPGVKKIAIIPTGVAVAARTFGQCIDGVRALKVEWNPGTVEGEDDESILAELRRAELPLAVPSVPALAKTVEADFEFMFKSSAALEPYAAVADVRSDRAEVWAGLKVPIVAQEDIAKAVGLPTSKVKVNVVQSGGSFGHKLFANHAIEAAQASKALGMPVRLMWHRADEPRQGRAHPMATSRIRATYLAGQVLTFEQRHTSVATDFSHGFGEMLSAMGGRLPAGIGSLPYSQAIFMLTQELPYSFGAITQLLNEADTDTRFNTGSMRNIYSPDVAVANELVVDLLAAAMKKDPYAFRMEFLKNERVKNVLKKVAEVGQWGRRMKPGTAQGIAIHSEYKGATACLVEIDCTPATVNRDIYHAVTGPRVTKAVIAIDAGLVLNPRGLEAQMMGGFSDGMALVLTSSMHLRDGAFLEASWDNYFYTRQWNVPPDFTAIAMPSTNDQPGGAGEAGVAASAAAVACAYTRATRPLPNRFPINQDTLSFTPKPFVPSVPPSPTDGLKYTY